MSTMSFRRDSYHALTALFQWLFLPILPAFLFPLHLNLWRILIYFSLWQIWDLFDFASNLEVLSSWNHCKSFLDGSSNLVLSQLLASSSFSAWTINSLYRKEPGAQGGIKAGHQISSTPNNLTTSLGSIWTQPSPPVFLYSLADYQVDDSIEFLIVITSSGVSYFWFLRWEGVSRGYSRTGLEEVEA